MDSSVSTLFSHENKIFLKIFSEHVRGSEGQSAPGGGGQDHRARDQLGGVQHQRGGGDGGRGDSPGQSVALSLVQIVKIVRSDWLDHTDATPALLFHKEPAQGTQSPLLGAFLAFRWFFMA